MNRKIDRIKIVTLIIELIKVILVLIFKLAFAFNNVDFLLYAFLAVDIIWVVYVIVVYNIEKHHQQYRLNNLLAQQTDTALKFGNTGIIILDEDGLVDWANEVALENNIVVIGEKINRCLGQLESVINNKSEQIIEYNGHKYDFIYKNEYLVLFKDITDYLDLKQAYQAEQTVIGLMQLDNYQDTIAHQDEQTIGNINANIRQKLINWALEYNAVVRRLKSDLVYVVINQENFDLMAKSGFDILQDIKDEADKLEVAITASLAFATGNSDVVILDDIANQMMELAQNRGGDQVIVKNYGGEIEFFGANSEISERSSKVRSRVMAHKIAEMIENSDNVLLVGHNEMDLDCFGALLALDDIAKSLKKESYILFDNKNIEEKTNDIYRSNKTELTVSHNLLGLNQAKSIIDENTLIIMVDHNNLDISMGKSLVELASRIIVVDHHRMLGQRQYDANIFYNEALSSSTVELMCELVQYQNNDVEISELEATIMYAGLLVDTDQLKKSCSSRTFEACAWLKKQGADIVLANDWLKDSMDDFIKRINITKKMEVINDVIIVCAVDEDEILSRTALAQAADYICSIKNIEASFVVGKISNTSVGISARSNGKINVQVIMEKMGGGGHFNAAGTQRNDSTVGDLKIELMDILKGVLK